MSDAELQVRAACALNGYTLDVRQGDWPRGLQLGASTPYWAYWTDSWERLLLILCDKDHVQTLKGERKHTPKDLW